MTNGTASTGPGAFDALEGRGVDTEPWWDEQPALGLLGHLLPLAGQKALGGPGDELSWWEERAVAGARLV